VKIGRLLLRLALGGFFIGHGTQKLFGWFGGHGPEGTAQFFEQLGLRPGRHHALAAGAAETTGGALMLAGFATPLAASTLTATMLTAINRVHLKNGPWVSNGGYEYNVILIAAALTLAEVGPGPLSIDSALGDKLHGPGWAIAALLGGIAGAAGAHLYAESQAPPAPPEPAPTAEAPAAEQAQPVA
jgi:putative oxidoreductase